MSDETSTEIVPVYVWEVPVRLTHWLIALSLFVLSATGLYIGRPFMTVPGEAGQWFVMGWMRIIHFYAAIVFSCAVIARVIWMFTGNKYARWDKFLAVHGVRRHGVLPTVLFYSFLRDKPAAYVGHNPVAGSAYLLVFGLYFLAIGTGLVMWAPSAEVGSPLRWFAPLALALRRLSDRAVDSPRGDVAPARLHAAPRVQRHPGGGHREERHDGLDLRWLQVGSPTRAGTRALPLATSRGDR